MGRVERGPRGTGKEKKKEKEAAEKEEVDLLEDFFYHIYEFLSPVATRGTVVNPVQVYDSVVPVNFVPIIPITFVQAFPLLLLFLLLLLPHKSYVL